MRVISGPTQPAIEGWETGRIETGASDERRIGGLEMIPWTMSRPYSCIAPENDNLGDGLSRHTKGANRELSALKMRPLSSRAGSLST